MNTWLVILCGGMVTYLTRLSFFLVADKGGFPDWAIRALRFVPPAVLTALVCQELLIPNGELGLSLTNPALDCWSSRSHRSLAHSPRPANHHHRHGPAVHSDWVI